MRRLAAGLLLVPALLLTGCGSSTKAKTADSAAPTAPAVSPSATAVPVPPVVTTDTNLPTVSGTFGTTPKVTLPKTKPDGKFVVHTVTTGTGAKVGSTDLAVYSFSVVDWDSGKTLNQAYTSTGAPAVYSSSNPGLPAFQSAIAGSTVGSRVLVVAPPGAAAGQLNPQSLQGIGATAKDTLVFVIDVSKVIAAKDDVTGTQAASPAGMPTVVAPAGKAATFTIPAAAKKPAKLLTAVLIKGTGPKVTTGQTIVVQYTGATLADGKVFDSSWSDAGAYPTAIGEGAVIPGWDQGLVGQTVGSRVLLSIPSALGYGAQGSPPTIPANADLVFVVDIVAAA